MTRGRLARARGFDVALVLLGAIALAGSAVLLWPRPAPEHEHPNRAAAAHSPTMLFIGDSYAGNSNPGETSYACIAAVEMGWHCELAAKPGTGYFSGGSANRFVSNKYTQELSTSFAERITALRTAYRPDVLVLDGGRNDGLLTPEKLFQTMVYTIGLARETWPDARIVVVRPRFLGHTAGDLGLDGGFFARLQSDPQAHGIVLVDPVGSVAATDTDVADLLADDGLHPNLAGSHALGTALAEQLESHGMRVAT